MLSVLNPVYDSMPHGASFMAPNTLKHHTHMYTHTYAHTHHKHTTYTHTYIHIPT